MKEPRSSKTLSIRRVVMITTAVGAAAVGAFAIGALAVRRLAIYAFFSTPPNSNPVKSRTSP